MKARLDHEFPGRVQVDVLYLNHDFAHYLGLNSYRYLAESLEANMSGLGDWFFRASAFPELADNTEQYWQRFFPLRDEKFEMKRGLLLQKRRGLEGFLARLIAKYHLAENDLVGFTSMFCQNVASFAVAKKLKQLKPEIVTVMGGANCETPMGQEIAKHSQYIDFVFSGPALISFPRFVQHRLERDEDGCHRIRGVFSKQNLSSRPPDPAESTGEDLQIGVPLPLDYKPFLAAVEKILQAGQIQPTLFFETSRGCWWGERAHCTFCGLNGSTMRYRSMTAEQAIAQFEELFQYWPRCTRFESVDNIMPKHYLREVFPRLNPPPEATIFYEVKADLSSEDMEVLSRAGVNEIQPGIESLATSTLKLMKKGTTVFTNIAFLKNCLTFGIRPVWNLLIGFPGEPESVYAKYLLDLPRLVHLPPPSGVYPVRFDRYSPYFVRAADYGLELSPSDFYSHIYPFKPEVLQNLAYYFADQNYSGSYLAAMNRFRSRLQERVDAWRWRWSKEGKWPKLVVKRRQDSIVIYDSRNGNEVEYCISPETEQILRHLTQRKRAADIEKEMNPMPRLEVERQLAFLKENGLVLEEIDSYMSLVLPADKLATG